MQIDKSKVKSKDTASNKSASKEKNIIFPFFPAILVFDFLGDCHTEFTLSWGTFFDKLRMSGRKSLMKTAKGSQ